MHELLKTESRLCRLSVPLLLRLFEYIREEHTSDEDLHFMAERISELAYDGVAMTMNEYQSIIPKERMGHTKVLQPNYEYNQTTQTE